MKRTLCSTLIVGLFAGAAFAADTSAPAPSAAAKILLPSGVDAGSIDSKVRAQDDFFHYSQGKWLSTVEIPNDRSDWGAFNIAAENVQAQLRTIIETAQKDTHKT